MTLLDPLNQILDVVVCRSVSEIRDSVLLLQEVIDYFYAIGDTENTR